MTSTTKTIIIGCFAVAVLAGSARAQDDVALFGNSVQPNVMIIFDNSGSMAHAMWPTTFDPKLFYDSAAIYSNPLKNCNTGTYNLGSVPEIASSTGLCPGGGDDDGDGNADECPESEWSYLTSGNRFRCANVPGGCASAPAGWTCTTSGANYTFTVPDITAGAGGSRWSRNYLHWIANQMYATGAPPVIPTLDRIDIAETAIVDVVDAVNPDGFTEKVRFGVATFGTNAVGGTVLAPIATGNKATVTAQLMALTPNGNTPLAESTVSIAQYLSGLGSVGRCGGSTTPTPGNPMSDWCRKNFVVMVTDGEPVDDDFSDMPGGTVNFTCAIGNTDGDTNDANNRTDRPAFINGGTDWFDDVTTYCYENDLRPDLNATQNIVTYTIGLLIDHPLLNEAAVQAGGTYFVANSAQELSDTLTATVLEIVERSTAFSAATVPSSRTAFSDGLFVASFIPRQTVGNWEGHLEAYRITPDLTVVGSDNQPSIDSTGTFIEPKNYFWDSADAIHDQAARTLYTNISGARIDFTAATTDYTTFGIAAGSPSPEWNAFPYDTATVPPKTDEELADDLVSYAYGLDSYDEDRDADFSEVRDYVLGDLFHSNPIVIGPPPFSLNDEEGYGPLGTSGTFIELYHQRDRRLFVGGNDTMLHAIDTGGFNSGDNPLTPETENDYYDLGTGEEVFAWVPGALLDTAKFFPRNAPRTYYYVDGSPSAADVWLASSTGDVDKSADEWTTLLVTGMRQGGRSYLALDITDPAATSSDPHGPYPVFQWEFDDPSEPMGETWSDPVVTRVKMRAASGTGDECGASNGDGDCIERWVVIVAGGYDDTGDPNLGGWVGTSDPSWTEYGKALFVLDAKTGDVLAKLERVAADAQLQYMTYVIPSSTGVLDLNFDGFADVIYVGDTGGQVWKWVLKEVGEDTDSDGLVDTWPGGRFFDSGSVMIGLQEHFRQIFAPPSAAYIDGDLVLVFGTGERSDMSYAGSALVDDNNRLYVITDPNPLGSSAIPTLPYDESDLTDVTSAASDTNLADLGYFIKGVEGEKFVTSHIIVGGVLITGSYVPPDTGDPICEQSGSSYAFVVDLAYGAGQHTDPSADSQARRLYAAVGVPSDPRVTVSQATGDVQLFLKGSSGQILSMDAPGLQHDPVEMVYWRQRF